MPARLAVMLLLAIPALAQTQPSCQADIGAARAKVLVDRCIDISPATHPPCNAANPCSMIRDEIRRGCDYARNGAQPPPAYCSKAR